MILVTYGEQIFLLKAFFQAILAKIPND